MTFIVTPTGLKAWPLAGNPSAGTPFPRRFGIDLLGLNKSASYDTLYRTQPWVHVVVNKLSRGIARLPWQAYMRDAFGQVGEPLPVSDLTRLLERPWPRGSGFALRENIVGQMGLYANQVTIMERPRPGQPPVALWPVPWRQVEVIEGESRPIDAYIVTVGGIRRAFTPEDVLHFQWWSPSGLGISPLEPLRMTLALEDAAQRYSVSSFSNGARPSGAVSTDSPMVKKDRDELRAEIEAMHTGVDNAFRIALLTHGLKWQPFAHSASEAELIPLRKLTREEVAAVYDIAPPMIQILDRATFSNIDEQHRMLYQDTYGPWLSMIEAVIDVQLTEVDFPDTAVRLSLDEVLRGDAEKRSIAAQRWFQSAVKTPNEARADEGKAPIGDPADPDNPANQVFVPVNMVPIAQAGQTEVPEEQAALASLIAAADYLKTRFPDLAPNGNGH